MRINESWHETVFLFINRFLVPVFQNEWIKSKARKNEKDKKLIPNETKKMLTHQKRSNSFICVFCYKFHKDRAWILWIWIIHETKLSTKFLSLSYSFTKLDIQYKSNTRIKYDLDKTHYFCCLFGLSLID